MKSSFAEELTLRRARRDDAAPVAAISLDKPMSGSWSEKQLEGELRHADSIFVVAEREHRVVSYVVSRVEAGELRIYSVGVDPEHARKGAARAALSFALERAKEAGCAKAALEVSAANARALALYNGAGFSIVGRRPKFYNDGSDALLMDLPL